MLPTYISVLQDSQLEMIMLQIHSRIEILRRQRDENRLRQPEEEILDALERELKELFYFFSLNHFLTKELMIVAREQIKERWQLEEIKRAHDYNYNKLSICIKFKN